MSEPNAPEEAQGASAAQGEAPAETEATTEGSSPRLAAYWLLIGAIVGGAALTGIADLVSSDSLTPIDWLESTATVAALAVAVGIYRMQDHASSEAHVELMDQLEAQNELINEFAKGSGSEEESGAPEERDDALTAEQRAEIEDRYGEGSIESAIDPGRGRGGGKGSRTRLVRLKGGLLASVYTKNGRTFVREIGQPRELRQRRERGRPDRS